MKITNSKNCLYKKEKKNKNKKNCIYVINVLYKNRKKKKKTNKQLDIKIKQKWQTWSMQLIIPPFSSSSVRLSLQQCVQSLVSSPFRSYQPSIQCKAPSCVCLFLALCEYIIQQRVRTLIRLFSSLALAKISFPDNNNNHHHHHMAPLYYFTVTRNIQSLTICVDIVVLPLNKKLTLKNK